MATHRLPVYLGLMPDPTDTTDPPYWEPYSILATNDFFHRMVLRYGSNNAAQPTTLMEAHTSFEVPQNYVDTANLVLLWTATITSGNVVWDAFYRAVGVGESADQATAQESVSGTDAAPGTTDLTQELTIALTDGNLAAGDLVQLIIARDGADASDTMAGSALLLGAWFEYNDA